MSGPERIQERKEDLCLGFSKYREEVESGKNNYAQASLFYFSPLTSIILT